MSKRPAMPQGLPEIRIKFGFHLNPIFNAAFPRGTDEPLKPSQTVAKLETFRYHWQQHEHAILRGMCEILDLRFYEGVINVYVVSKACNAFSDPIVLPSKYDPALFVDVLTHELLHRLLCDNTRRLNVSTIWKSMFPSAERLVRNHVLVDAVQAQLYVDVLGDSARLDRVIRYSQKSRPYAEAWRIVETEGATNIIENFRKLYDDKNGPPVVPGHRVHRLNPHAPEN